MVSWGCALMFAFIVSVLAGSTYLALLPVTSKAAWAVMPITIIVFLAICWALAPRQCNVIKR